LENGIGNPRCPVFSKLLTLPNSSAEIERIFSFVNAVKTKIAANWILIDWRCNC